MMLNTLQLDFYIINPVNFFSAPIELYHSYLLRKQYFAVMKIKEKRYRHYG